MAIDPYDMTDEELEAAFREAKAELNSPDLDDDDSGSLDADIDTNDNDSDDDDTFESDDNDSDDDEENTDDIDTETGDDDEGEQDTSTDEGGETPVANEQEKADRGSASNLPSGESVKHTFKANGKDYEFTEDEMREQFPRIFGQAMDYTRKMQAIKPWRKTIDAVEQAKLTHDDINLMIDVFNGNKDAITEVLRRTGVDVLDIDPSAATAPYVANQYGRDDAQLELTEVIDSIKHDQEYSVTHAVLSKVWDDASWNTISKDPAKIKALHSDVKSGIYAKVQPIADKLKLYDNARQSDLDYYLQAGRQYFSGIEQEQLTQNLKVYQEQQQARLAEVKNQDKKRKATQQASGNRRAAGLPARSTQRGGVVDYINASDEDFEAWLTQLEDQS